MLALFPGCSHTQVYPVLVAQHAKRNFTKHMVNIGREMGNLQIATYTHTHSHVSSSNRSLPRLACMSFYQFSVPVETRQIQCWPQPHAL